MSPPGPLTDSGSRTSPSRIIARRYMCRSAHGQRRQVSARAGINGAPAWSPDGHKPRAHSRRGEQSGHLCARSYDAGSDRVTDDPPLTPGRMGTRWALLVLHLRSRRRSADLRVGLQSGARPKRITFEGTYNAAADLRGRQRARRGHARSRQLPNRRAGICKAAPCACCRAPPRYLAELCAEQRRAHLFGAGG